jgi:hypothetical protein
MFGFRLSARLDVWPDPDFSLLPVAHYRHPQERVELHAPEIMLATHAGKANDQNEPGARSEEGWDAWFLLFGLDAHKRILSQEVVSAAVGQPSNK